MDSAASGVWEALKLAAQGGGGKEARLAGALSHDFF